jgi:hypothetical protein
MENTQVKRIKMSNTIKAVIYTEENVIDKTYPELKKMFKEKYEKDLVNHYEIVSKKNKDND